MEYKIQAYDVHANGPKGHIHFQVLQPDDKPADEAKAIAEKYMVEFAADAKGVTCEKTASTQGAADDQVMALDEKGYFILKVHGCPESQ